jgi:hypothetical protein
LTPNSWWTLGVAALTELAHDHERELLEALEDRTEELIRELEGKEKAAGREPRRCRRNRHLRDPALLNAA